MIGLLRGTIIHRFDPNIIIDVNGVGYKVFASHGVLSQSTTPEQIITIYTYTHVREDTLELFGFLTHPDLLLFEQLLSVSGIGPKTAIAVFSIGDRDAILNAISSGNITFFTTVPRLGTKNAQKIIIELKGKVDLTSSVMNNSNSELIVALQSFGFSMKEIQHALSSIEQSAQMPQDMPSQIKLVLKYLGK